MKTVLKTIIFAGLATATLPAPADETMPVLRVGSEVYSNVTVTSVTATHIYFSHARGLGDARLKNLAPELQARFHYQPATAEAAERKQLEANAQYRQELNTRKPPTRSPAAAARSTEIPDDTGDLVVPRLYARSFRGQRAPDLLVEKWVTAVPDTNRKFVLVDFWATWCGPCRASIPHLNQLQARFRDQLVVIGLSDEPEERIQRMTSPRIDYYVASDRAARTKKAVEVRGIPHAMLIDPRGVVRFEGMPNYLDETALRRLLDKYGD